MPALKTAAAPRTTPAPATKGAMTVPAGSTETHVPAMLDGSHVPASAEGSVAERMEAIRERAYHLWDQAGRPEGSGFDYWLEAERELGQLAVDEEREGDA